MMEAAIHRFIILTILLAVLISGVVSFKLSKTFPTFSHSFSILRKETGSSVTMSLERRALVTPQFEHGTTKKIITLSRYMVELVAANPELTEMESLVSALQIACKTIANVVERASISGLTGLEADGGSINIQGEEQKK